MLRPCHKLILAATLVGAAHTSLAQEKDVAKPADGEPKPKGYDDSFYTGDIPKPKTPELDPDVDNEVELNPAPAPDPELLGENGPDLNASDFRLGVTAAINVPHLLNFAAESILFGKFGVSVNYGNVTRNISDVDVAMKHLDIRARWFPWGTSFFAGLALGQHEVTGEMDENITEPTSKKSVSTHGKLVATAKYAIPHFGWFSVWDSGFTMGADLGYLIPSGADSKFTATFSGAPEGSDATLRETTDYKTLKKDLEDAADQYASKPIPYLTLLRMGWMF